MEHHSSLKIERIVAGGWGLTHVGSKVTFVRGVLPEELVTITSGDSRQGYQYATLDQVQELSPDRVVAPCSVYAHCGGCQFQHIRYDAQLRYKQQMLEEAFSRIGQLSVQEFLPPIPSPFPYEYRRWIRFSVFQEQKAFHLGFVQERSHKSVKGSGCLLFPESIRLVVEEITARLGTMSRLPELLSTLEVRASGAFGSHLIILKSPRLHQGQAESILKAFQDIPSVAGCVITAAAPPTRRKHAPVRLVRGEDHLFEQFQDMAFRISDRSFMQANWAVYAMIYQTLEEWLGDCAGVRVLELFAGIGCLGLSLARKGAKTTVVEENPFAVADARKSASVNHIGRCRFRPSTAEDFLSQVQHDEYDVILVDPPRTGLSKTCVETLIQTKVPRIFYVSCDAPSLARDAKRLCAAGYQMSRVQLFDMFPQTAHIETLVEFTRQS
jgi:23S rRNA (uracil1939-C5)-methyltransferase